jgi:hypothetical protein
MGWFAVFVAVAVSVAATRLLSDVRGVHAEPFDPSAVIDDMVVDAAASEVDGDATDAPKGAAISFSGSMSVENQYYVGCACVLQADHGNGAGVVTGLGTDHALVVGLRGLFRIHSFRGYPRAYVRLAPELVYSRTSRADNLQDSLAAEYVVQVSGRLRAASGLGGGIDLPQNGTTKADPWLEAHVMPTVRILQGANELGVVANPITPRSDLDLGLQLRLVRQLGDARTIAIVELGIDYLWW